MTIAAESVNIDVEPSGQSAVAWGAIIGGALAAAAISLILMVLGTGFGLSVVSPWSAGATAGAVAVGSVIWLVVVQWLASGVGGYLAGRLRKRTAEPADEVFFRDTANGFLAWALSTLIVAALLTSALSAIVGAGTQVAGTVASGMAQGAGQAISAVADPTAYFVDTLYRQGGPSATVTGAAPAANTADTAAAPAPAPTPDATGTAMAPAGGATMPAPVAGDTATAAQTPSPAAMTPAQPMAAATSTMDMTDTRAETSRMLANGIAAQAFPSADVDYLSQLVAERTGVSADAAKERVNGVIQQMQKAKTDAQAAVDAARKNAARLALYMFLSFIVGAFIAAAAAALGGGHRDDPETMMVR